MTEKSMTQPCAAIESTRFQLSPPSTATGDHPGHGAH